MLIRKWPPHSEFENGLSSTAIPEKWALDELLKDGRLYFCIPVVLWDEVLKEVGQSRFSDCDTEREKDVAAAVGHPDRFVGVWKGASIPYRYLHPHRPLILTKHAEIVLGKTTSELASLEEVGTRNLSTFEIPTRAYLGWLLSNPTFINEHNQLTEEFAHELGSHGFPQPLQGSNARFQTAGSSSSWVARFRDFYDCWRLQSLAAPYLPAPLEPLVPDYRRYHSGTVSASIPDIAPVPGRGPIDEVLETSAHHRPPEHLEEWFAIIAKENSAKNMFASYERRFRLQHYWRLLHSRYRVALHRKKVALIQAFATYFEVSTDSVKGDLRFFKKSLGDDWMRLFS